MGQRRRRGTPSSACLPDLYPSPPLPRFSHLPPADLCSSPTQETVGSVTGSTAWTESGAKDKQAGLSEMKAAGEQRNASQQGMGKPEELAGKAFGCEGMEREGQASATKTK